jgi:hypothetical protein
VKMDTRCSSLVASPPGAKYKQINNTQHQSILPPYMLCSRLSGHHFRFCPASVRDSHKVRFDYHHIAQEQEGLASMSACHDPQACGSGGFREADSHDTITYGSMGFKHVSGVWLLREGISFSTLDKTRAISCASMEVRGVRKAVCGS